MGDFDKLFNGFIIVWVIAFLAGLGLLGVIIWGLIQVVPALVDRLSQ